MVADGSQERNTGADTYSPVLKLENVKVVLAAIAQEGLDLNCIDIKKAFFKGRLQQPVYLGCTGFCVLSRRNLVCPSSYLWPDHARQNILSMCERILSHDRIYSFYW